MRSSDGAKYLGSSRLYSLEAAAKGLSLCIFCAAASMAAIEVVSSCSLVVVIDAVACRGRRRHMVSCMLER